MRAVGLVALFAGAVTIDTGFLPIIGTLTAGLVGAYSTWRFIRPKVKDLEAQTARSERDISESEVRLRSSLMKEIRDLRDELADTRATLADTQLEAKDLVVKNTALRLRVEQLHDQILAVEQGREMERRTDPE